MSGLDLDAPGAQGAAAWCLLLAERPLSAAEQARFESWLAADPAHAARFDDAVMLWRAVGEQAPEPEMIVLRGAALDNLRRANRLRWARDWGRRPRAAGAIAAVLVAAVALGLWQVNAPRVYATDIGERQVAVLSDGSKLSLDADTRVKVRYAGDRRELTLVRGRALFSVAKDPKRPFTVAADGKVVRATGTEFSVERLGGQVRVILYEGRVAVLADQARGEPQPVRLGLERKPAEQALRPGGELVLSAGEPAALIANADMGRSLAWEGGQLVFSDEPLSRAVERMNRYADKPIALADAEVGGVLINGVFTAGDTEAFVEGVTAVFPVRARQGPDGVTLAYYRSSTR